MKLQASAARDLALELARRLHQVEHDLTCSSGCLDAAQEVATCLGCSPEEIVATTPPKAPEV